MSLTRSFGGVRFSLDGSEQVLARVIRDLSTSSARVIARWYAEIALCST